MATLHILQVQIVAVCQTGSPPSIDGRLERNPLRELLLGMGRPAQEAERMADRRAWEMHSEPSGGGAQALHRMLMK